MVEEALGIDSRPTEPDAAVLAECTRRLNDRFGIALLDRWAVTARLDRPSATVFRLVAKSARGQVVVYYKAVYAPADLPADRRYRIIQRHRDAWAMEAELAPLLADALAGERVDFDEPVVLDLDRLHAVRLGIGGRQLGRAIRYWLPPKRRYAREVFELVGHALRIVDSFATTVALPSGSLSVGAQLSSDLERLADRMSPADHEKAALFLASLQERGGYARPLVWTHRDMSPTNILVDWPRLGLIDFTWEPDLRHRDLANLVVRLAFARPLFSNWAAQVIEWVMDGYGLRDTELPDWSLALFQRAVKSIPNRHRQVHEWGVSMLKLLADNEPAIVAGFPMFH